MSTSSTNSNNVEMTEAPNVKRLANNVPKHIQTLLTETKNLTVPNNQPTLDRELTQECVLHIIGIATGKVMKPLLQLGCECDLDENGFKIGKKCHSCQKCDSFEAGDNHPLSDEDIINAILWLNIYKTIKSAQLGKSVNLPWIHQFRQIDWKDDSAFLFARSLLEPYLVPHEKINHADSRLIGRLQRLVSFPHTYDDLHKPGESFFNVHL